MKNHEQDVKLKEEDKITNQENVRPLLRIKIKINTLETGEEITTMKQRRDGAMNQNDQNKIEMEKQEDVVREKIAEDSASSICNLLFIIIIIIIIIIILLKSMSFNKTSILTSSISATTKF